MLSLHGDSKVVSKNKSQMIAQVVITVSKAKRLIARAIYELPEVRSAIACGKVVLKGGTTVSAIAELFGLSPLKISGRIAVDGLRGSVKTITEPHNVIYAQGVWRNADVTLVEDMGALGPNDVVIIGANALDTHGIAGMLTGAESGGIAGKAFNAAYTEGVPVIIAVGLEKLIPGSVLEASRKAGRKKVSKSMGMAVGLLPLYGRIVTEQTALEILTGVSATVIAAGGICGAEGATTLLIEGLTEQVEAALHLVTKIDAIVSGQLASLQSCNRAGSGCARHLACIYRRDMRND